tara:strand:+ start:86 stop:622 length:537 start_codon:yes stop_codon:yes gene_type:complete
VLNILIIPLIILISYIYFSDNVINKISFLITSSGYLALIYLSLVLLIPFLGKKNLQYKARDFGIATFYLSLIHFLIYILDNSLDLEILLDDLILRNYIISGYLALLLFVPMYLTSFSYFQRLYPYWRKIHKIVYLIYFFILAHIYFIIKADYLYLFIFIMLFSITIIFKIFKQKEMNE